MSVDSINTIGSPIPVYSPAQEQLTSGQRINKAADDAAGLAIATGMSSQLLEQSVGMRNANDGMGLLQTASGAVGTMTESVQRMYELSTQAMNGTYNSSQRQMMNIELQQQMQEMDRIAGTTKFNGIDLLNGQNSSLSLALGSDNQSELTMPNLTSQALGLDGLNLNNPDSIRAAMEALTNATELLSTAQAEFGAQQNGLQSAVANMAVAEENTYASRSQITDADMAKAASQKARSDVLNQAELMMLANKNSDKANILQLIS